MFYYLVTYKDKVDDKECVSCISTRDPIDMAKALLLLGVASKAIPMNLFEISFESYEEWPA
jgi:hypothetical protein